MERISTFIEELGRKSVPPQTEVRDNAAGHDLKLADIAAFFNACQNQSNPLTMGEQALLEQLSGTGFLSKCNGIYESTQPAALIGMSRSGVMTPRNEVALHEIAHAYYFVDADFRTDVNAVWSSLKPHEQKFLAGAMVASGFYASGDPEILQTEAHAHSIEKVFEGSGIVNLLIYAEQNCDKAPETKGCSDFWSYRGEIEAFLFSLHNRYAEISECRLPLLPCTPDKKSTTMMTASSIHAAIKDLSYKEVSRTVKGIDALSKLELPPYARRNPSPYARMNMLQARFDQRHHRKKTQ
ncbi:MAG: hypothetical protein HY540_02825 [Deltaproteobacteria bacterium]|nr:hypothetical protein [Deltaproteobacteria bacterium]